MRRRALIAYGWIGSSEIDYIVAWLVDDEDAVVRETAAWALGMCQSKEGAKAIARRIPEERDRVARTVMQRALRRLRLPEDNGP